MSDDKGPFGVSRRIVIGAASAAPVVSGGDGSALADPAVARCAEWMALDAEIDRLGLRWSDLETTLVRQKRWEQMTPEERGALSPSAEMDAIDKQLEPLFERREAWLETLAAARATDIHGVVAKLEVALRVMAHQQGDGYELFKATMDELRTARCPNCGGPFASVNCAPFGNHLAHLNLREPGPERSVLALERLESVCRAGWCGSRAASPSLRDAPQGRTLDARQSVRPLFHQAIQGVLSPSEVVQRP